MSALQNLPQNPHNNNQIDPCNPAEWLKARIEHYEAEVSRLESELQHARILLRGHETWLADLQRKAGQQ